MDINNKIEEKEAELKDVSQQINKLTEFGITLQGYLQALYEQRSEQQKTEEKNDAE